MPDRLEIINPVTSPNWDQQMLATGKATFFHSSAWAATLAATYGYKPCYFVLLSEDNTIKAMVPLMEVSSFITGKRGISLPFSDHCEIISESAEAEGYLLGRILGHGKKQGWEYLELRPGKRISADLPAPDSFQIHTLSLSHDEDELLASFRESTRRNIRKAEAAGITCTIDQSMQACETFYALNCYTRKRHGIPPQPLSFFRNVYKQIIAENKGIVVLASHKNKIINGAVYFHFGRRAMFKYGASSGDSRQLCGNYLVMWQAIRFYRQRGCDSLDMGRTDSNHNGLLQFKNGWNALTEELVYCKYSLKPFGEKNSPSLRERIIQHMPLPLLRMIGTVAYRHVA